MTRRWHIGDAPTSLQLKEIAEAFASGSVVLMPTDTIYGLHAVHANEEAVARIAEIKGRDENKPFIVLASSVEQFPELGITASPEIVPTVSSPTLPERSSRPNGLRDAGKLPTSSGPIARGCLP